MSKIGAGAFMLPLPLYISYLPIKRSPQQQQVKEHSTQEKEHFTQEKEHFTQEKEHFTQEKIFF